MQATVTTIETPLSPRLDRVGEKTKPCRVASSGQRHGQPCLVPRQVTRLDGRSPMQLFVTRHFLEDSHCGPGITCIEGDESFEQTCRINFAVLGRELPGFLESPLIPESDRPEPAPIHGLNAAWRKQKLLDVFFHAIIVLHDRGQPEDVFGSHLAGCHLIKTLVVASCCCRIAANRRRSDQHVPWAMIGGTSAKESLRRSLERGQ